MADLNQVRRRADDFARLVDGETPSPSPVQDPEFARAMDLVAAMREAGSVQPRPEFSAALRQRLVDEAEARITATPHLPSETDLPGEPDDDDYSSDDSEEFEDDDGDLVEPTPLQAARARRGRLIAGAAAFVLLAGGVGSAAAAQQSMPGDRLYALKRGLESVASKASVTEDSRGRRDLSHALARLTEAEHQVGTKAEPADTSDTLRDFSTATRSGGGHLIASFKSDNDAAAIEKIYVFAAAAGPRLEALAKQPAIRPAVVDAVAAVNAVVGQAHKTCPTCLAPGKMGKQSPTATTTGTQDPNEPSITGTQPSTARTDLATPAIPGQVPTKRPTKPSNPSNPSNTDGNPTKPSTGVTLPTVPTKPGTPKVSLPLPSITLPTLSLPTISLPPLLQNLLKPTAKPASGSQPKAVLPGGTKPASLLPGTQR